MRGLFTFHDDEGEYHVYKQAYCQPDGPHGAVQAILDATRFAWALPRFEADEFAAAFVCSAKMPSYAEAAYTAIRAAMAARTDDGYSDKPAMIAADVPSRRHLDYPEGGRVRLLPAGVTDLVQWEHTYRYRVTCVGGNLLVLITKIDDDGGEVVFSGALDDAVRKFNPPPPPLPRVRVRQNKVSA